MGVCTTKQEKKSNKFPVEKLFPLTENQPSNNETVKSEFYYFVEWMISFNFYKRLHNNPECANINILNDDLKQSSIFKLIKVLDCSFLRERLNSFSVSSDSTQIRQSINIEKDQLKAIFFHLAKTNMNKLKKLLTDGPPNNMRWLIWFTLAKCGYEEVETKLNIDNSKTYKALFSLGSDNVRQTISNEQTEINASQLFNSNFNYQSCLINVITVIVTYDKNTTNSIELNNIVANALIVSDLNEEEAFFVVRYIYSSEYGIQFRDLIHNGAPRLIYYLFIIDKLLESRCPNVYTYLSKSNLNKTTWIGKWIQSLYCFLHISSFIRVWDCVFALGCDFLIYFTLGCIKFCEKEILASTLNDDKDLNEVIKTHLSLEKAIKFALDFHISKYAQIKFDQAFFNYLVTFEEGKAERSDDESSIIENNEDLYQEKINKIKLIYHQNFSKEEKGGKKLSSEEKIAKINVINKLKEAYFKDNSIEKDKEQEETQMLCSLANKSFADYIKEKNEDKKIQLKVQRYHSNVDINKTKSQKLSHRVHFLSKTSQNDLSFGFLPKKNYSVIELNNEDNNSSDMSSIQNYHNYSIINQVAGTADLFDKIEEEGDKNELKPNNNTDKDNINNSIITPEDFNEDSFDEEAMIKMIEEKGIDSFLKENAPKKIVRVNP